MAGIGRAWPCGARGSCLELTASKKTIGSMNTGRFGACGASAAQDQVVKSQNRRADGRDMLEVVGDHLLDDFRASVYFSALTLDNAEPPKVL